MQVYLAHDADIELIDLTSRILTSEGIDVFTSPFDLPGTISKIDEVKRAEIENCDILVALITRESLRSTLMREEIRIAESKHKVVIPVVPYDSKIHKVSDITGFYQLLRFDRLKQKTLKTRILSRIIMVCEHSGLPLTPQLTNSVARARSDLPEKQGLGYTPEQFIRPKWHHMKSSRLIQFSGFVADLLKEINYSIEKESKFILGPSLQRNVLLATRAGEKIGVYCIPRSISEYDVDGVAYHTGTKKTWIVCDTVARTQAYLHATSFGVELVETHHLLNELSPSIKESYEQRLLKILKGKQTISKPLRSLLERAWKNVLMAKTPVDKWRSLEQLAENLLALVPGLKKVGKNVRIEAQELDLVVANEVEGLFWERLGTPIILECKNWTERVGAPLVRDLVRKMREVKTALLVTVNGVTSKSGAWTEILEARKEGKFILVLDAGDIERIIQSEDLEETLIERFYSLWLPM